MKLIPKQITDKLPQGKPWRILGLIISLILFFVSLELLGEGFELLGEGAAENLIAATQNPITGVFVGILATTLVQSSTTTTTLTVALVAAGTLTTAAAIPIVLGANIGTSITNTIVALGHINRQDEFKRAFTGALVLDVFNIVAVFLFLILELMFQVLSWPATQLTNLVVGVGALSLFDPLDYIVDPIAEFIVGLTQETGWLVLIVAFALLYFALQNLVQLLRSLLDKDLEGKVKKYLFGSAWQAMLFGFLITTAVQSSSITTSVVIPIIALGVVVAIQALPYFLGANIGTSTTALIAAMSLASDGSVEGVASLNVAFVHMVLEFFAIALLFPIRKIRRSFVWLAEKGADFLTRGRITAIVYVAIIFYALPFGIVMLTQDWDVATGYEPVVPQEVEEAEAGENNGDVPDEVIEELENGDNNES